MVRVTSAVASRRRRKRILKRAKGFFGDRKNHVRLSSDAVMKALSYNYIHRKQRKRNFRRLWIVRIVVAAKINGMSYSKLICGLKKAGCLINRKMLANMAISDPKAFKEVVDIAKQALAA